MMAPRRTARHSIPDRLYFKIGEVARIVGVEPHVLRYWETEFPGLKPGKARSRHRLYKRSDVELLMEIKRLLHGERFTIEGARRHLKGRRKKEERVVAGARARAAGKSDAATASGGDRYRAALLWVKKELEALRAMLR